MAITRQAKAATSKTKPASQSPNITQQSKAVTSKTKSPSRSPKTTRRGKAVASKTKSPSQSPKITRQREAAASETESVDPNNEDYNIRSPKRTELLTKIKGVINNASVSPTLWACCQLADIDRLQAITKWEEDVILSYEAPLASIALRCELLGF
jgi:hypothetical protein